LRRLGVGGGGGGGERPFRAQLIVALVVGLVLLAVPLYLWRRPSGTENAPAAAASANEAGSGSAAAPAGAPPDADATPGDERIRLASPQRVRCGTSTRGGQEGNLCDRLTFFEEALVKAIAENVDCAPKLGKEGTINFVLRVDFTSRKLHVFPGASGSWRGPVARKAAACVKRALPAPDWAAIPHQYRHYSIAVLATYPVPPPPSTPVAPSAGTDSGPPPLFE